MKLCIRRAVVLGAGVMGASIAAHLAGCGLQVTLLDMPAPKGPRNALAAGALKGMKNPRTRQVYAKSVLDRITPGNLEDDLGAVADADWVVEAIVERLEPKADLFGRVAALAGEGCILSSNTSGISVDAIAGGLPQGRRARFLGTHFFNPPRYMNLLELIPTQDTDPALLEAFAAFARDRLGKSVVVAKDTPNFIANRIGVANTSLVLHGLERFNLGVGTADFLTGRLLGRPAAGTLRTCDLVGFDIVKATTSTNNAAEQNAADKALMTLPAYFVAMMESGALGDKSGRGFFAKGPQREPLMWDRESGEYIPRAAGTPAALEALGPKAGRREQILALLDSGTPEGDFVWFILRGIFAYSAARVPEITDDFRRIDLAMQLGYNWTCGPFQLWEELGAEEIIRRMEQDGVSLPPWVGAHLKENGGRFYGQEGFGTLLPRYLSLEEAPVLWQTETVRLLDLGDGVGAIALATKGSAIGGRAARDVVEAVARAEALCRAAVFTSLGKNFCAGANLQEVMDYIEQEDWKGLDDSIALFQQMTAAVRYAGIPIVAAAFGAALGGGAELCLHAHRVVAHAELNMGLVEPQMGLIPAGGGLKELACRIMEPAQRGLYPLPLLTAAVSMVGGCTVSTSALHAVELGLLRESDRIVPHRDQLLEAAKAEALHLSSGFVPALPGSVRVLGESGRAACQSIINDLVEGGFASEYDGVVSAQVARVLCGGSVPDGAELDEDTMLRREREGFVHLCRQPKTRERIQGFLRTGKPVQN